jgi:hypothetical protein
MLSNGFYWNKKEDKYVYPTRLDLIDFEEFIRHPEISYNNIDNITASLQYIEKVDIFWNHSYSIYVRDNSEQIGFFLYILIYIGVAVKLSKAIADTLISRKYYNSVSS